LHCPWEGVEAALTALVGGFDPDAVLVGEVILLHDRLQSLNRQVTAAITLLARRVDEVQEWKRAGYASAAEFLAAKSGSSVAAARDVLATSSKLTGLPVVEGALRAGKLSGSQAVAVTDAASMAPAAQARLVNEAQRSSLTELRQECLRTKAAADGDREATRARIHRQRYLRAFTDAEGAAICTCAAQSIRSPVSRRTSNRSWTRCSARLGPRIAMRNATPTPSTRWFGWPNTVPPTRRPRCVR